MKKNDALSRVLALLLAAVLALSCADIVAFATETGSDTAADGQTSTVNADSPAVAPAVPRIPLTREIPVIWS